MLSEKKRCSVCGENKLFDDFYIRKSGPQAGTLLACCKKCHNKRAREWEKSNRERARKTTRDSHHRNGYCGPWDENPRCGPYLGFITENILSMVFGAVERMPPNNHGYDFVCKNGYKIDAKGGCLLDNNRWRFNTYKNITADYFICIGFDNRESMTPLRAWIIPCDLVRDKMSISIGAGVNGRKWKKYEYPITDIIKKMKN